MGYKWCTQYQDGVYAYMIAIDIPEFIAFYDVILEHSNIAYKKLITTF